MTLKELGEVYRGSATITVLAYDKNGCYISFMTITDRYDNKTINEIIEEVEWNIADLEVISMATFLSGNLHIDLKEVIEPEEESQ